jgi:tRNA threonylcarbamoyl adenosine modification protein YjeE
MTAAVRFEAADLAAFEEFAAGFARTLRAGDVVALEGELGAGKTTFVAAVVKALGSSAAVASPTFVFRHSYAGSPPLEHLDLYRIERGEEALELGLHEAFTDDAVVFVEWPERLPDLIPATSVRVRISGSGPSPRLLEIERG